jgi:hypothetical protein
LLILIELDMVMASELTVDGLAEKVVAGAHLDADKSSDDDEDVSAAGDTGGAIPADAALEVDGDTKSNDTDALDVLTELDSAVVEAVSEGEGVG